MRKSLDDPRVRGIIACFPFCCMLLLEWANCGQLYRMWTEHTSEGQNPYSWMSVGAALVLWMVWYRTFAPEQKVAFWATLVGFCLNTCVWLSVFYWRTQ
jgi:hypothetical protein